MSNLPKHIQEQIENEALALTAKSRSNNDYQSGYNQGIELGYEKGATAYASKLLQAEDMMHKMAKALEVIMEQSDNGIFPHLPVETVGAAMCINIRRISDETLADYNKYKQQNNGTE